jgi:hypothetical protein
VNTVVTLAEGIAKSLAIQVAKTFVVRMLVVDDALELVRGVILAITLPFL